MKFFLTVEDNLVANYSLLPVQPSISTQDMDNRLIVDIQLRTQKFLIGEADFGIVLLWWLFY